MTGPDHGRQEFMAGAHSAAHYICANAATGPMTPALRQLALDADRGLQLRAARDIAPI
jgi:hypothetical protein